MTASHSLPAADPPATATISPIGKAVPLPAGDPPPIAMQDFLAGPETRLRDLLAFGMAAEAGRALGPDGVETLRKRAEAELEAHAFRVLHNQVEAIRRDAAQEAAGRLRRGLSFTGAVAANMIGVALVLGLALLAWNMDPRAFAPLADSFAQLLAQFSAR